MSKLITSTVQSHNTDILRKFQNKLSTLGNTRRKTESYSLSKVEEISGDILCVIGGNYLI